MAVYACSDLHGQLNLYRKIKEFIKPEDVVYCIGDCGDRGPQPWQTIKAVYNDEQFIYLKGNHEDMLIRAMRGSYHQTLLLYRNGGANTHSGWELENEEEKEKWKENLSSLVHEATYINKDGKEIILSHAGYTPSVIRETSYNDKIWGREHFWDTWDEDNFPNTYIVHGHTPLPFFESDYDITSNVYCNGHKINIDNMAFATNTCILLDLDTFEQHIIEI